MIKTAGYVIMISTYLMFNINYKVYIVLHKTHLSIEKILKMLLTHKK
jgi:hypothetical protein